METKEEKNSDQNELKDNYNGDLPKLEEVKREIVLKKEEPLFASGPNMFATSHGKIIMPIISPSSLSNKHFRQIINARTIYSIFLLANPNISKRTLYPDFQNQISNDIVTKSLYSQLTKKEQEINLLKTKLNLKAQSSINDNSKTSNKNLKVY